MAHGGQERALGLVGRIGGLARRRQRGLGLAVPGNIMEDAQQHVVALVAAGRVQHLQLAPIAGGELQPTPAFAGVPAPRSLPVAVLAFFAQPVTQQLVGQQQRAVVAAQHADADRCHVDHRRTEIQVLQQPAVLLQGRLDQLAVHAMLQQVQRDAGQQQQQEADQQRRGQVAQQQWRRQVVDQPPAIGADALDQRHATRQSAAPQRAEAVVLALLKGRPARAVQPRRLAGQCRLSSTVQQRVTADALAIDHPRRCIGIKQQYQPLRRLRTGLHRLCQCNATLTRAQPVHRVRALQAAVARLQYTQRWQARQVDVDRVAGQPMCTSRIDQQQVRLQRLQRVLGACRQQQSLARLAAGAIQRHLAHAFAVRSGRIRAAGQHRIAQVPQQGFALVEIDLGLVGGGIHLAAMGRDVLGERREQVEAGRRSQAEEDAHGQAAQQHRRGGRWHGLLQRRAGKAEHATMLGSGAEGAESAVS